LDVDTAPIRTSICKMNPQSVVRVVVVVHSIYRNEDLSACSDPQLISFWSETEVLNQISCHSILSRVSKLFGQFFCPQTALSDSWPRQVFNEIHVWQRYNFPEAWLSTCLSW